MHEERIREIVERVAATHGLEVVEVLFRGGGKSRMLRVFIDKLAGVTHQDCERISRDLSAILDVEDAVPGGSYTLEVSSPGLDRKLVKPGDYQRFQGSLVKLFTRQPVEGVRYFEGRLESFEEGRLRLALRARKGAEPRRLEIELANVEKANLVPEF